MTKSTTTGCTAVELRIQLLGAFSVQVNGIDLPDEAWHSRRARNLIKLLALSPAHCLHREVIANTLWPDSDPSASANNFHQTLYTVRRILAGEGQGCLILEDGLLHLLSGGNCRLVVDVDAFEAAAAELPTHLDPTALNPQDYLSVLALYKGDLLPEDLYEEWLQPKRDALRELQLRLLLQLTDYYLEAGEYLAAIDKLQNALSSDPANEAIHLRLMRALALGGQRLAALRQYQRLEESLRRDLDMEPGTESQLLREQIRKGELAPPELSLKRMFLPKHNLPAALSSFIGREREIETLQGLARSNRLVVLTGPGGVGKTRLALAVAQSLLDDFSQGVYWIELAALTNLESMTRAILGAFRLPEHDQHSDMDQLVEFLKVRQILLLFDNCEHLHSECALMAETLLQACSKLHILATSRVRLNLAGEVTYPVPSLAVPDSENPREPAEIAQYDAVRLFIERSAQFGQKFTLTKHNTAAVAQICTGLDGIPLALELAAARTRILTAEQIAGQLKNVFHLLERGSQAVLPHHRTMQASIEWSYCLLTPKEQLLLQKLSVFSGGWELEASEEVCSGEEIQPEEVLDLLGGLVDQSMVTAEFSTENTTRYHLLEIVRQYAQARLVENGGLEQAQQRHLAYYRRLAERTDQEIRGPNQLIWIRNMEPERGNFTSALERSFLLPSWIAQGAALACSLNWYWNCTSDNQSVGQFLRKAYAASADFGQTTERARILYQAGVSSIYGGAGWLSLPDAKACLEESLEIWKKLEPKNPLEETQCRLALGYIRRRCHNDNQGLAELYACLEIFKTLGNIWWQAWALNLISAVLETCSNPQTVWAILEENISLWRKAGDHLCEILPVMAWGQYQLDHGEYAQAMNFLSKGLALCQKTGSVNGAYQFLRDLGHAARALGEYEQAEVYYENCIRLSHELNWGNQPAWIHAGRGFIALHQEDAQQAEQFFMKSFKIARSSNWANQPFLCFAGFAGLFVLKGKLFEAVHLLGAYSTLMETHQVKVAKHFQAEVDLCISRCRAQLKESAFEQTWNEGCALTLQQAAAMIPMTEF